MYSCMKYPLIALLFAFHCASAIGQDTATDSEQPPQPQSQDKIAIQAIRDSYTAAFNAKDIEKLISHWTENGVYVSRSTGEALSGREALKAEFTSILDRDDAPKLAVQLESLDLISPNVALERGSAIITRPDSSEETTYQLVYLKQNGDWRIDRVSEDVVESKPSHYEQLKELEFLVGTWSNDTDGVTIEIDCQWTANQNFLSRQYRVLIEGEVDSSGLQIIGWDAKKNQVRSWLFDSDGGFVDGQWTKRDDGWIVQSVVTLADGASGSATSLIRSTESGDLAWRKFNRVLDGKLLPNTEELILQRQ